LPTKPIATASPSGFPDPAVQKSIEVDLALMGHYDDLLRDVELSILKAAKQDDANTLYLLRTVPGIGEILSLVLLYEIQAIQRFPRADLPPFVGQATPHNPLKALTL
jgi:transposase